MKPLELKIIMTMSELLKKGFKQSERWPDYMERKFKLQEGSISYVIYHRIGQTDKFKKLG